MRIRNIALIATLFCLIAAPPLAAQAMEKGAVQTAPGVSIYYEKYGSGPQVILVPNLLYMPEMRTLARPGRTLILYDMRNRGQSGRVEDVATLNIMADVADVEALRRHFGAEKISLIGYSYLGLMVALYASEYPEHVERLVQIGAVPRKFGTAYPEDQTADIATLSPEGRAAVDAWRAFRNAAGPKTSQTELCRAQQRYINYWIVGNPANAGKVPDVCIYENENYQNQARHLDAHFADIQKRDFPKEAFTKLSQPVLTLHGTLDRNAPYGSGLEWATTFRDGRLITVPGGAHQLWLDDPSILHDIDTFLAGNWPERALKFGRE